MTVRTFVACVLDPEATARVAEVAKGVRVHAEKAGARATWVKRENLHVSIKFLGEVENERLEPIAAALREIASKHAVIALSLPGLGAFPPRGKPRVLFVSIAKGADALAALAADVETALAALGFAREAKSFTPHVTIARVKQAKGKPLPNVEPLGDARVASLTLFSSELTPAGPVYRVLREYPLR